MGGGSCCMAVMNQAPASERDEAFHQLGVVAGRAGAWQKYTEVNSLRMDIPKSDLPADDVPQKA